METGKTAAAMQDFDDASDYSPFSIITPTSTPAKSSCGKCSSQDKARGKDSGVASVENDDQRTKNKTSIPTKATRLQFRAPESNIHSLIDESEHLFSKLDGIETALRLFRMKLFEKDTANKSQNKDGRAFGDDSRAGCPGPQLESRTEAVVLLQDQVKDLWEGMTRLLRQAGFEDGYSLKTDKLEPADRRWCLELLKCTCIASIINDAKRDAALVSTALGGITEPPLNDTKNERKAYGDWQPDIYPDHFSQPHPENYGMPPMAQLPGPPDPYARTQPTLYPQPPYVYGTTPVAHYPCPPEPYIRTQPMPYPPPPNPEDYRMHPMDQFAGPPDPWAGAIPLPYSPRPKGCGSVSSVDFRPIRKRPTRRINKIEVRWWLQTALSFLGILRMIVIVIAVFKAPGLLGQMLDVMYPGNNDRCLGFRVRR